MFERFQLDKIHDQNCRDAQEDSFWAGNLKVDGIPVAVVCVCDGMGGLQDGKNASRSICNAVRDHFKSTGDWQGLTDALVAKSNEMFRAGEATGKISGTTCTVLVCSMGRYKIFHIGDTRCYLNSSLNNGPVCLTCDHTWINMKRDLLMALERADPATDPQAQEKWERARIARSRWRNKLFRCLCTVDNAYFDEYEGAYTEGDTFLVCSDGFWHYITPEHFTSNAITNLDGLVREFIAKGEQDNMTAVLLTC